MGSLDGADGPDVAAALVKRAQQAGAEAAQATHVSMERFELDADTADINLVTTNRDDTAEIAVFRDGRRGSATLTGRDDATIAAAIRNALDSADAARPDSAHGIARAVSTPPTRRGPDRPDRVAMIGAVRGFLADVRKRFPSIRIRNADYSFEDRCRSFANSIGVHRQERRAVHRFWTLFSARNGERSTSFNSTGGSAYEPFERLIEVGGAESLILDTLRSFDPEPVPGKFDGDVIVTPNCAAYIASILAGALDGYALIGGITPMPIARESGSRARTSVCSTGPRIPEFRKVRILTATEYRHATRT